jgi:glycerophosphoryl diester phosphodiesterase
LLELDFNHFYCIGHRGNEIFDPENSLAAFMHAAEINVDFIETDVQNTKDNQAILFHDQLLNKKTDFKGSIKKFTLDQLKRAHYTYVKDRIVPLCTLEELFDYVSKQPEPKTRLILELKYDFEKSTINQLLTLINLYKLADHIIIDSFLLKNLKLVRECSKTVFLSRLMDKFPTQKIEHKGLKYLEIIYKECLDLNIRAISLHRDDLIPAIIRFFKEKGLFVFAWGIQNTKDYDSYISIQGLNGFTASNPDELIRKRKELLNY